MGRYARAVPFRPALRVAASLACGLALAGAAGGEELLVGAAASLREPVEAAARDFEAAHPALRVRVSYGASSALAAQLRAGAPLALLLVADLEIARELAERGLAEPPLELARNRLVAVAAPGVRLAAPEDLLALRRIAVPDGAVPVGRYARAWLQRRGLLEALGDRLVRTEHARATLLAVEQGAADAAIVYATDARLARRARLAFAVPAEEQPEIVYAISLVRDGDGPSEAARAFAAWWRSEAGRGRLRSAGFATAP